MASLAQLMVQIGADISNFTQGMSQVQSQMQQFGQGMQNTGKRMTQIGTQMTTAVTVPLLGLGTAAVVIGAKFDKQMSKVMAISGATGEQFDKLRKQALDLGSSTSFSSSEVAFAMENLASAGMTTEQIMASISGVLDMAASSGVDLATAADIAGSALNGFKLDASEAGRVSDVLAKSAAISAADTVGLGEAFKYTAPVSASFGHTIEETAAAVGLLSNAGIKGGQAGTVLRAGLLRLAKPSKEARESMDELGMSFFDSQGKMKPMSGIVKELETNMKGLTDEQKAQHLATIFGTEAVSGWLALMSAGSGEIDKATEALKGSNGEAEKMAKIMNDNLAGAWDGLTGAIEALAIGFADVMKPALQDAAKFLTDLTNKFNALSPSTKKIIVGIGLFAAIIPPLIVVIGLVISAIGTASAALGGFLLPVIAVVGGITLLVAMFKDELFAAFKNVGKALQPLKTAFAILSGDYDKQILKGKQMGETLETMFGEKVAGLVKYIQLFQDKFRTTFNQIKAIVSPVMEEVKTLISDGLTAIKTFWDTHGSAIMAKAYEIFSKVSEVIVSVFEYVMPFVSDGVAFIRATFQKITDWWNENGTMIMTAVSNVFNFIWSVIQFIMPVVKFLIESTWNSIKGAIDGVLTFIMGAITFFSALFTGNWGKLWEGVKGMLSGAVEAIWHIANILMIGRLIKGIGALFTGLKTIVSSGWTAIKGFFTSFINAIKTAVTNWINGVKNNFNMLRTFGASVFEAMRSVIVNIFGKMVSGAKTAVNNMKTAVTNVWNSIKSTATTVFNAVKTAITKPIETAKNTVMGIINAIKGAFTKMKITIPKPKLPKINIGSGSKTIAGVKIPYPTFSVSWNAKGGIFDGASILGGGQGVGEAGAEAVLPIQHKRYMAPFAGAIADHLDNGMQSGGQVTNQFTVQAVIREEADIERVARKLYELQTRSNRTGGRG
jgi:TP901 family phage tail tape measure protein